MWRSTVYWCVALNLQHSYNAYMTQRNLRLYVTAYDYRTLQWRHNECAGVSNHQTHGCLLNRLFRHRSKNISKLRVIGLCEGNSLMTGKFPAQKASNAENVSIWWHHHESKNESSPYAWIMRMYQSWSSRTWILFSMVLHIYSVYLLYKLRSVQNTGTCYPGQGWFVRNLGWSR